MSNIQHILSTALDNLYQQKLDILNAKLKEAGIEIDWEAEKKRRFRLITVEQNLREQTETYFYNDGSIEGMRIVTFIKDPSEIDANKITVTYSYF